MKKSSQINKATSLITSFVFFTVILFWSGTGQTVAIGHVTAEVVESVSASSHIMTNFSIQSNTNPSMMNTRKVDIGDIAVASGQNVSCNVIIKPAVMSNESGSKFVIEPNTTLSGRKDTSRADGSQSIHVTGTAMIGQDQVNGQYNGSYTMVFAYN
jgi:hypothetical protein